MGRWLDAPNVVSTVKRNASEMKVRLILISPRMQHSTTFPALSSLIYFDRNSGHISRNRENRWKAGPQGRHRRCYKCLLANPAGRIFLWVASGFVLSEPDLHF